MVDAAAYSGKMDVFLSEGPSFGFNGSQELG
jgi:hypothetical protein